MASSGFFTVGAHCGAAPLPTAQQRADAIQAEARAAQPRPLFKPPPPKPPALADTGDIALLRVAEELAYMQRILESVGGRLADDGAVALRHAVPLQQFDVVGQVLGHLANVISTDQRLEAMRRIGMEALRARLSRGLSLPGSTMV